MIVEFLRVAKRIGVRALAALLVAVGALAVASIRGLKALRKRALLWPWLAQSYRLVLGTIAYNAFVFLIVQPVLRRWFPPLSPWEHVQGVFSGSTRATYEDVVPVVATGMWIAGNALVITLARRKAQIDPAGAPAQ